MKRRRFIKNGIGLSSAFISLKAGVHASVSLSQSEDIKSRIVVATDADLQPYPGKMDTGRLVKLLDKAMQAQFDLDNPVECWRQIFPRKDEVVGLKVNCLSGRGSTHIELVEAIQERLFGAGIKPEHVIIWDRFNSDLEDAGFKITTRGKGPRCYGNDMHGFDPNLFMHGEAASLICRTVTRHCQAIINLPVLRDHSIAGLTLALKNLFGAIHNPNKYHLTNGNPYIADVYALKPIHQKVRLTICDAVEAQYQGGPSWLPQWRWPFNGLLVGTDPVAMDTTGRQIIDQKRLEMGMSSLALSGREPRYIHTAADAAHRLGFDRPERIQVVRI